MSALAEQSPPVRSRMCTLTTARAISCMAYRLGWDPGEVVGLLGRNGVGKKHDA